MAAPFVPGSNVKTTVAMRRKDLQARVAAWGRNEYRRALNALIRASFYRLKDGSFTQEDIDFLQTVEFGTRQWSDDSYNIQKIGYICSNSCLYCYINPIFNKNNQADIPAFYRELANKNIQIIGPATDGMITGLARQACRMEFAIDEEKAAKNWSPRGTRKLFMSPTSHDIFPENVAFLAAAWKRMVAVGHEVLIVSKPRIDCISYLCRELADVTEKISFRFTITTLDQDVADIWEPLAPSIDERMSCLELARDRGFKTSASIEPFLSDPVATARRIDPLITDTIWVGMMNGYPSEKILGIPFTSREKDEINRLKLEEYTFQNVDLIVQKLRGNQKINWKESVIKLYLKERCIVGSE